MSAIQWIPLTGKYDVTMLQLATTTCLKSFLL